MSLGGVESGLIWQTHAGMGMFHLLNSLGDIRI